MTAASARNGTATITYSVTISSELLRRPIALAGSPACGSASGGAVGLVRVGADKETPVRWDLPRAVCDRRGRGYVPVTYGSVGSAATGAFLPGRVPLGAS